MFTCKDSRRFLSIVVRIVISSKPSILVAIVDLPRTEARTGFNAWKAIEKKLKNVGHNVRRIGYLEIIDNITHHWPT